MHVLTLTYIDTHRNHVPHAHHTYTCIPSHSHLCHSQIPHTLSLILTLLIYTPHILTYMNFLLNNLQWLKT